jgi:hypothetical protein
MGRDIAGCAVMAVSAREAIDRNGKRRLTVEKLVEGGKKWRKPLTGEASP